MRGTASNLDENIGVKLRNRRKLLGFTPHHFAGLLGISHQQLNKYENGMNRISASQLGKISKLLSVDIGYFMQDGATPFVIPANIPFKAAEIANQPETTNLVKYFIAIPDPRVRMAFVELVTSVNKYFAKRA